jgi:hypothetical protein
MTFQGKRQAPIIAQLKTSTSLINPLFVALCLGVRNYIIITNERDSFWAFPWIPGLISFARNDEIAARSGLFFVTVSNNRQKCRDSKF